MADTPLNGDILSLTAQIVSAHVSHNSVPANAVPSLIQEVYRTLTSIERGPAPVAERPEPAVPVKKSITPDYIICLEDGKKLKMLKRHLKTSFNLTPDPKYLYLSRRHAEAFAHLEFGRRERGGNRGFTGRRNWARRQADVLVAVVFRFDFEILVEHAIHVLRQGVQPTNPPGRNPE